MATGDVQSAGVNTPELRDNPPTVARTMARILVADASADVHGYLTSLPGEHWNVDVVADGAAALTAVHAKPPDLVLADLELPVLDGLALLRALHDDPATRTIPVLVLTELHGEMAIVESFGIGSEDSVIVPIAAYELITRMRGQLELARVREEAAAKAAELDAVFEAIADGVLVYDLDGRMVHANRAYRSLLQTYLDVLGRPADMDSLLASVAERKRTYTIKDEQGRVLPPEQWATQRALRGETLTGENAMDEYARGPDGRVLQVNVAAAPIRTPSGQIKGAVGVFRDVTARRQLERLVQEQASQLEAIFDAITDSVIVLSAQGRVTRLNPAARQLFGLDSDENVPPTVQDRARVLDVRDAEGQPLAAEQLPEARLLGGEVLAGSGAQMLRLRTRHGDERIVSLTGGPMRDASGQVVGAVEVLRDVTELRWTQAALAERERFYFSLVENSPDIITRFDQELRLLYINPAAEAIMGIPAGERIGKTYAELGLPETLFGPWEQALREVFVSGEPRSFDTEYRAPGTPVRYSHVRYIPEFAVDGSVESVLGITTDITGLKRAESALRESELRFLLAFHASPTAITITSLTTFRIVDVNDAASELTGYSRDEMVGRTVPELGIVEQSELDRFRELRRRHIGIRDVPIRVHPKSGGVRQCVLSAETIWLSGEECMITIIYDVTERVRAVEALAQATVALEVAKREEELRRHEAERREQIAESLRDVLTVVNSRRRVTNVLEYIAHQAGRLLDSDSVAIYTTDVIEGEATSARTGPLTLQAAYGLVGPGATNWSERRLSSVHSGLRTAMVERRPAVILSATKTPGTSTDGARSDDARVEDVVTATAGYVAVATGALPAPYQALLAIPIVAQDSVYGGILLLYSRPHRFEADDVALAIAYADHVALAIANARLQVHIERAARDSERNRIAWELHDTVTQEIFSANLLAEAIPRIWDQHRVEAERSLHELHQLTRSALAALRTLLLELRPGALEQRTLEDLLRQLGDAMAARAGVPIEVTVSDECGPIPPEVKFALYRVAQEALTNAVKHAAASRITVQLSGRRDRRGIRLEVKDDGRGFETGASRAGRLGIRLIRERARLVGASLQIRSRPGQGTRVVMEWTESANNGGTATGWLNDEEEGESTWPSGQLSGNERT